MDSPKYLIVQEWIKSEINKGTYVNGDKIPSENELMDRFGFSRQTVRLAISNLENIGYLEKVKGSGTYVNVRTTQSNKEERNIGVILRQLDYYIYPEIIKGIEYALMQNGYTMTLGITHDKTDKEMTVLNSMMEKKLDGIIAQPTKTAMPMPIKDVYARISSQMPLVFLDGGFQGINVPVVSMDYVGSTKSAVEYLVAMGHRNIGAVLRSDEVSGHLRYEGFTRTLIENRLHVNHQNVLWYTGDTTKTFFTTLFRQVYFSGMNRCTAILCQNDKTAEAMINNLKEVNVKPFDEVSIISFDNSSTAEMLGLTSMEHAKSELGAKAAETLLKQIKTKEAASTLIKSELVIRDSVHKRSFSNSWESGTDLFDNID